MDDLEKLMAEKPDWFTEHSYMYGCGPGWHPLIRETLEKVAALNPQNFRIVQIKEKFGGLRIYAWGGDEETSRIIHEAMNESYHVCENCGSKEGVENRAGRYGWFKSFCLMCHAERMKGGADETGV
jgi:hypothetical protein